MYTITLKNTGKMNKMNISKKKDLFTSIKDFVSRSQEELIIISPYIQTKVLKELLSNCNIKKVTIITTWKLRDIQFGSSDLEIYTFCKENGYHLFLNQRVHLKAIINNYKSYIFGSANISNRGLALTNNFNYELMNEKEESTIEEIIYFKRILKESIKVNDRLYEEFKKSVRKLEPIKKIEEIEIEKITPDKDFLISTLPMSKNPHFLFQIYSKGLRRGSKEDLSCAMHDIVLYGLPVKLNKKQFLDLLKERFFESKFVKKFLKVIDEKGMYFGSVKEWIQKNCTDVPIPSKRDLTGNIQVLYQWVVYLSEGKYKIDIPKRHSERIYKIKY